MESAGVGVPLLRREGLAHLYSSSLLKKLKTSKASNLTERDDQNNKDVTKVQSNTATDPVLQESVVSC